MKFKKMYKVVNRKKLMFMIKNCLVGATTKEPSDMRYLYENHEDFGVLPTYYVIYGPNGASVTNVFENIKPGIQVDPTRVCN